MQTPQPTTFQVFLSAASPELYDAAEDYVRDLTHAQVEITRVPYDQFSTIGDAASNTNADMILLAITSDEDGHIDLETAFARFSLDSDIPVMVLRHSAGTELGFGDASRIVVPLDGSSTAAQALPLATRIATLSGLPVHFVMVIDPSRVIPAAYAYDPEAWGVISELRQTAHWALRQAEGELRGKGIDVGSDLLFGPVNACLREAVGEGDLVVMTTHGSGRAMRRRVGSVARRILASTRQPIVIKRATVQGDIVVEGYEACSWVEPLTRRPGA